MKLLAHFTFQGTETVLIESGDSIYQDTASNFALDYGSAISPIPGGDVRREYAPLSNTHITLDANDVTTEQTYPWTEGDDIIADIATIISAKITRETPSLTLEQKRTAAKTDIDSASESARLRYITFGSGQAMVYLEKYDEALIYKDAGYPTVGSPSEYPHLTAEATSTSQTEQQVADLVIATRDAWIVISAEIEGIRMGGKKDITDAADEDGINTARDNAVAALDAI